MSSFCGTVFDNSKNNLTRFNDQTSFTYVSYGLNSLKGVIEGVMGN